MAKPKGIIHEQLVDIPQVVSMPGSKILEVTITCHQASGSNVWVGWNEIANPKNTLEPGESRTYGREDYYLDGNKLQIGFEDPTPSLQPMCLISMIIESDDEPIC